MICACLPECQCEPMWLVTVIHSGVCQGPHPTAWLPEPQLLQLPQPLSSWPLPQQPWPEPLRLLLQLQPPQSGEALQLLQPRRLTGSQTCAEPPPLALQVAALPAPAAPADTSQSHFTLASQGCT